MSSDLVSTIRFLKLAGPYTTHDVAGFPHEVAEQYVNKGFAVFVDKHVPAVDPQVRAFDARRRAAELRAMAIGLEAEAAVHQVEASGHRK